ncbi:unnamed protein product [Arctia plantaginis]|uniref:THD domain-containing protein n=1 Tax=Arctia plantaginis TaxID=874455 RepID=A0A8S1A8X4_ARCPL|nr:unnamed protein product [Arctia plantaginis]
MSAASPVAAFCNIPHSLDSNAPHAQFEIGAQTKPVSDVRAFVELSCVVEAVSKQSEGPKPKLLCVGIIRGEYAYARIVVVVHKQIIVFIMDGERKIHMSEGVPLNSTGAASIFLNTGRNTKVNSPEGTVIHLKTEKPSDLGVHINTTFSIASSKKIKLLFVLNFLLSVICMIISCSIAFYYWNEIISMRRQLDMIKDQFIINNINDKGVQAALVGVPRPPMVIETREPRMKSLDDDETAQNARKYYVDDLGEDMLLVDSKKKNSSKDNTPVYDLTMLQKELVVVQFNGAKREHNMGTESIVGPWIRDEEVSSKNSEDKIGIDNNLVVIKEGGLYLIYAQLVYLTQSPNCYFIWTRRQATKNAQLLSTCSTGDDSSNRPLNKSQMSCSVQTVARLYKGDTVNIAQREPNRTVWLRPGYSYFGFVKLSS